MLKNNVYYFKLLIFLKMPVAPSKTLILMVKPFDLVADPKTWE